MAQVAVIQAIPPAISTAMSRRAPLSNLPNAVNSTTMPTPQTTTSMKRSRSASAIQRDVPFGQPPPKKQALEAPTTPTQPALRTPIRRSNSTLEAAAKAAVPRRPSVRAARPGLAACPPAFVDITGQQQQQQQLQQYQSQQVARRQSAHAIRAAEAVGADAQGNSDVRAWQRHYRKAFPSYVFFFENIPADVLVKAQKQITSLGAVSAFVLSIFLPHRN